MTRRSNHTDYTTREITRPGLHVQRRADATLTPAEALEMIDPLDATDDDARHTPVEGVAIKMADRVRQLLDAEGYPFTARDVALLDALSLEMAQRLAEMHTTHLDAGEGIPRRIRALETHAASHAEWRGKLTGVDDRNGRIGRLEAAVSAIAGHWKRIVAAVVLAASVAGGGIYSVRAGYDAAVEARGRDGEWRRHVDADLARLFAFFNLPRSNTP